MNEFKRHVCIHNKPKKLQNGEWNLRFGRNRKTSQAEATPPVADVVLISHIGGHAFAGNVIIYFPKRWKPNPGKDDASPLAGKGVWYGRVEPRHVWGIVEETVMGGRIIEELLRGVRSPQEGNAVQNSALGSRATRKGIVDE